MPRQDSLGEQLADVLRAAVDMGCYDAHDWIVRAWHEGGRRRSAVMPTEAIPGPSEGTGATNLAPTTSDRLIVLRTGERPTGHVPCGCRQYCDDCPEDDDNDLAVCKGLPYAPA